MTNLQKLALVYATMFFSIVSLGYIPGFTNDQGLLFGSFKIDLVDDILHGISCLWALFSGLASFNASRFYFRAFGIFYTADAFLGFFTGYAFTDFVTGNFGANAHYSMHNLTDNILVNLPHFIIGPLALYIGFQVSKQHFAKQKKLAKK